MKNHYGIGIIFLFCVNFCSASVFKWTDKNGTIHFSDKPNGGANMEKIENHFSGMINRTKKHSSVDPVLMYYMTQLIEISKEISNDADSCYNVAISKNEIDISCKNYNTVLNRDFKPLLMTVRKYIIGHPISEVSRQELQFKLIELEGIAKEGDGLYQKAINHLSNVYNR